MGIDVGDGDIMSTAAATANTNAHAAGDEPVTMQQSSDDDEEEEHLTRRLDSES